MLSAALLALALQSASQPTLTFRFERDGLPVPRLLFTVHPDGTGTFTATVIPQPSSRYAAYPSPSAEAPTEMSREITLSPRAAHDIFEHVHTAYLFHLGCESKAKNIAFTGTKTFTYQGPDGEGNCTYNYTENKQVAALTETFIAIAFTLDEGRRLEQLHRYDRLGLDQEMRQLATAQHDGHALELGNIAPVLTSIANDPAVLERVRSRAAELLATAER